ncbi:coiled-coil domain-containing protein 39 [Onychostruthus taczanowskii]|uniref:coiled-coil domain-containing protein 39 n=1 Tax=Onychostruthus taczanowskii TaxID=356909 RepID=UPI001B80BF9B|nr:coiled-coil domain-containing protein 39 [Onychostruthus taczanowskii]
MEKLSSPTAASVLAELQWEPGYAVPVANAENKALEDELHKLRKEKEDLQNELTNCEERIEAMTSHLKNVRQEINLSQSLYKAKENEIETEHHFKALAEREYGRLKNDIKRLKDEIASLREKKNTQENTINKTTKKLENLKQQMNWDEELLESWLQELNRTDNDAVAIQKYAVQDEGKLGKLTLQIEKLTMEANQKHRALDNELTETITAQMELDRAAEDFRRVHRERQEVIRQWENAIRQMQKRDQEIDQCALLIAEVKQEIRNKEILLREKTAFLVNETVNNMEYEKKILTAEREANNLRKEFQAQDTRRTELQDELQTLKSIVNKTASDLESLRTQITNLKKEIQGKQARLKLLNEKNANLSDKLKLAIEETLTAEEKALRLEEILKEEEKSVEEKENEMRQLKDLLFKKTQELKVQSDKEKIILAEIEGGQKSLKSLKSRLCKLDTDLLKQQELIYNQDFYIQQIQRRLSRLEGEVNSDEKEVLEGKAAELKKTLEEKKKAYDVLQSLYRKLQNDVQITKRTIDKTREEANGVIVKIEELTLFNERSLQELKKAKHIKQEMMVEDNLLKLELKRLRNTLCNKAEKVLTLEKQQLELKKVIAERTEEIRIHKAMLDSQIRLLDQERHRLSAEFQDRLGKIDKLKHKYEMFTFSMMPPEGEEMKSQAYYVIKAAQEKEALQQEGDDLDAKICQAQKEIMAMENSLCVLKNWNRHYKNSFKAVPETSEEREEKLKLEKDKKDADEKYKYKQRKIKELQENLQSMQQHFDIIQKQQALLKEQKKEKEALILQLKKDIEEQKPKLNRVIKQCSKLSREIKSQREGEPETLEERDIHLRELKAFNKTINQVIADVLETNPGLVAAFQMYFDKYDLELPMAVSPSGSQTSQSLESSLPATRVPSRKSSASSQVSPAKVVELTLAIPTPEEAAALGSQPATRGSISGISHSRKT